MGIELPGWLRYVGGLVGEKFPEGDETACRRQADRWNHYADQLQGHNDAIEAAARTALDGFSSGVTHDALIPQLNSLTSGDQSIEKIVKQLRQLAQAVNDAATEIEFAKEMFILNLGILAASLAAMIASAWINWGAPAEMAAAIAATEAVLSQIIRTAIGKIVSEAAVNIIERLAIRALEGAAMNAAISGGMNAAVQGQQIMQGHRRGFDWGSVGQDVEAGAIQGAVAAPFLKGPETRTPGFHPSERLSEFGRSFAGNTLGGLAAQVPSGHFDVTNAVKGGAVFGAMDGARPTPKSIRNHWADGDTPADRSAPHTKPDAPQAKGPELSEPQPAPAGHSAESAHNGSDVDVPLNLTTSDHGGGDTGTTHTGGADVASESSTATRTAVSDSHGTVQPTGEPAARSADSVAPQTTTGASVAGGAHPSPRTADPVQLSGRHEPAEVATSPTDAQRAETAPAKTTDFAESTAPTGHGVDIGAIPRGPELTDPSLSPAPDRSDAAPPRVPDRVTAPPAARGPDRVDAAATQKAPDRTDPVPPKAEGARLADRPHPQTDVGKATTSSHGADAATRPGESEGRAGGGSGHGSPGKDNAAQQDSIHHSPGFPDAAAPAPVVLGPALGAVHSAAHDGSPATSHDRRAPHSGSPGAPERIAAQSERGGHATHAGLGPGSGVHEAPAPYIDASRLPAYRQRQMELALSAEMLQHDLLNGGCPSQVAASARHSPYEGLTRQELIERYCNPDGSVRWPPNDGFAGGRFEVADRVPAGQPLDRIGEVSAARGDFMGSAGDSYPSRALAPGSSGQYHRLEGAGKPFSRPTWELRYGKVAEAFDQPGGGRQWVVVDTSKVIDGVPHKVLVDQLIKEGYVRVIQPDSDHPHVSVSEDTRPRSERVERIRQLAGEIHQPPHIREHAGLSGRPAEDAGPHTDSHHPRHGDESLFTGEDLTADERQALREVWDTLTPDERHHLFSREPMFGEHAALPVTECDHYARQAIGDMRREILERADRHEATAGDGDRLLALDNIEKCLDHEENAAARFLLGFEPDGRSISAVGNPDAAKATVVFVPGTFTSDERLNNHTAPRGLKNLFGLLKRAEKPGYMEISERIWERLAGKFQTAELAVVDYQNYHAPQDLANPFTGAPNPRFARDGAAALRNHLDRLQHNGSGKFWVVGHSYGTVLVGEGAKGGHGLNADGLINLGSPGMRVPDVSGLQLKGQHLVPGDAPVHTMTRVDDPIHIVDGARQTRLHRVGVGHGLMPHHPEFGGHVWHVDTNAGHQPDPHNAYFLPGSAALDNIAKIVAGERPPPEIARPWTTRSSLPFTTGYFRPPPGETWSADPWGQHPPDLEDPQRQILDEDGRTVADLVSRDELE